MVAQRSACVLLSVLFAVEVGAVRQTALKLTKVSQTASPKAKCEPLPQAVPLPL